VDYYQNFRKDKVGMWLLAFNGSIHIDVPGYYLNEYLMVR